MNAHPIYLGTILLERNRHKPGRLPTFKVSDWLPRIAAAGFDGIELWENHAALADEAELAALDASPVPITVLNSYCTFADDSGTPARAVQLAQRLGAAAIKWNFNRGETLSLIEAEAVTAWRATLPEGLAAWCECHPGTPAEHPEQALAIFEELGPEDYRYIVHPLGGLERMRGFLDCFGSLVIHAHMQARDNQRNCLRLDERPGEVRQAMDLLEDYGFKGSFTLEFTAGTNQPDEHIAVMFDNALRDLEFLREALP